MLPRVTMPRITLGKEREDRDKQHESLRCSCRTKHPLSASLQESVQLLHGNNAALLMGHLGSVCLQDTEYSSQRFCRLTHKAAGAVGPSEHQALCISAPCNWRGLPAVSESFWKAQTFFTLWSVLLKGVTSSPQFGSSPFFLRGSTTIHPSGQHNWATLQYSVCLQETCRVIRPIPACWGHPGLQESLQHCTVTQRAEETLWKLW